jgi:hypothetical protein
MRRAARQANDGTLVENSQRPGVRQFPLQALSPMHGHSLIPTANRC